MSEDLFLNELGTPRLADELVVVDPVERDDDALAVELVERRSGLGEVSQASLSGYRSLAVASGLALLDVVQAGQENRLGSIVRQVVERRGAPVQGGHVTPRQAQIEVRRRSAAARVLQAHTVRQRQLEIRRRRAAWAGVA